MLWGPLRVLTLINTLLLRIGRHIAWVALVLMVVAILMQVWFRYAVGNALAWPEEAARFLMLWMTGLIAPSALRWGGFVAIDMVPRALPGRAGTVLNLGLLALSLVVLSVGVQYGYKHVVSGCLFNSASLYVPFKLEVGWLTLCKSEFFKWDGFEWNRVKLAWVYKSLWIGMLLMVLVTIELILRNLIMLIDPSAELEPDPDMIVAGAD